MTFATNLSTQMTQTPTANSTQGTGGSRPTNNAPASQTAAQFMSSNTAAKDKPFKEAFSALAQQTASA